MKRKKLNMAQYGMLAPNVQRGGQAIPIGDNLYLMKGRQHSAGGIDIGKDLEVENNEVMQMLPNETRVFSSMPMLGGYSPAQLVTNGNNPDLVFNAQERWKQENRVRDDGSTYKGGGIHINPANKGKFTAQAKQHGMGVQSFANKVLAHKENYSPTTVKRATFAKYIGGRKPMGGKIRAKYGYDSNGNPIYGLTKEHPYPLPGVTVEADPNLYKALNIYFKDKGLRNKLIDELNYEYENEIDRELNNYLEDYYYNEEYEHLKNDGTLDDSVNYIFDENKRQTPTPNDVLNNLLFLFKKTNPLHITGDNYEYDYYDYNFDTSYKTDSVGNEKYRSWYLGNNKEDEDTIFTPINDYWGNAGVIDNLIAELSHHIQFEPGNEDILGKESDEFYVDNTGHMKPIIESYDTPGYAEYNAHKAIEPHLINYIYSKYTDDKDRNTYYNEMLNDIRNYINKDKTYSKYKSKSFNDKKPLGGISRLAKLGKRIKGTANDGSKDIYYDYDKKRWVYGLNRTVLPYGHKVRLSDGEEYQLNSDGTKTKQFKVNLYKDDERKVIDKKSTIAFRNMDVEDYRMNNSNKNRIKYDKNREIVLTSDNPRFRAQNVKISEALLDTLANASRRNNLPFSTVAGLAYRESTLGANLTDKYVKPYSEAGYINPTDLFTTNSYIQDNPYKEVMNNYKGNEKDFDAAFKRAENKMKSFNVDENPIDYALRQFKSGNYNRGDSNYNSRVLKDAEILLTSPQIREYMNKHNLKKAGGKAKVGELQNKKYDIKTMNKQSLINPNTLGSIVRMDGNGIDKLAYIPFTGNRPKTLKAGGRTKAYLGTFAHDDLFNIEYLTNPYMAYNANNIKDNNSTDNDIFKERMKYVEPYFKGQSDIPGYINAGVNALGSVVTSLIANNAINKQRPPVKPMPLIAPKLKTNVNINADLDANREATRLAIHDIKKNTASSQVGRNLINQQLFAKALADSKLYTDAENKRTTLINDDITQRAEIINKNIEKGNAYRQSLADFYSNKALAKGQNWAQMVNGLGQAVGMGLNNIGATNTKKLNALIAMLPAIETFMKNKQS